MNPIDYFDHGVDLAPDAVAFWQNGVSHSYAQIQALTFDIGRALVAANISTNPKVAVYSPNDTHAFACVLGTHRAGGTWIPLNARGSVSDNIDFLNTAEVEVLFYHSYFSEAVVAMRQAVPTLQLCVCIDKPAGNDVSLVQFIESGKGCEVPDLPTDPNRIVSIFGTGGTTGKSKGVVHTNLVWQTMIAEMSSAMRVEGTPVHLMVAPMTHAAGGICYVLLSMGAKTIVMPQPDPTSILQAIQEHKVTHLFLPPTVFYMLLAHPQVAQFDYSSLRYFLVTAAPVSPDKIRQGIEVFGPCICQCWGQTEAPMILTWMSPQEFSHAVASGNSERLLSCGRSTLLTRIEVMGDDGRILPHGEIGELVCRSHLVTPGYYKNEDATREISAHGWHHTGDVGYRDKDGFWFIIDRKKDLIITGGFNVYGAEVEKVINSHPSVVDVAVIGVPDAKWGEAIKAVVQLRPGANVEPDALIALCKERLGSVKAPKSVDFVDALPRSPVGKVLKREIRERYWQGHTRAIG